MITYAGIKKLLNWFIGKTYTGNYLYVALSSTEPTIAGANVTEPAATSYGRVLIARGTNNNPYSAFGTPSDTLKGSSVANDKQIYFPETFNSATQVVEDWGELKYICVFDSETGGNLLAFQELPETIHPGANNESTIPIIRIGDAMFTISNPD